MTQAPPADLVLVTDGLHDVLKTPPTGASPRGSSSGRSACDSARTCPTC
ncbi:hypothetical protein OG871_34760 [Kitasatospora sp. NBC_00374]